MAGTNETEAPDEIYEKLSVEEKAIVDILNGFHINGHWDSSFFKNAEHSKRFLKPKIVDYVITNDCLGTMRIMKKFLEINLAIAENKNASKKVKIQATNAAADIAKSYSYLMDNIVKNTQRGEDDEKAKPPAPPSFYAVEPAAPVANSGEPAVFAKNG